MNDKLKQIAKYILFMAVGTGLFYLAFRNTEFEKLANDFRKADYTYVILSIIMGYLAFISRGMRWVLLLEPLGKKPNTWNAIHSVTVGYFANMLVPRAGELARCTALYQTDDIPVNRLFGTVILERVIDFLMLLFLVLLTLILEFDLLMKLIDTAFSVTQGTEDSNTGLYIKIAIGGVIVIGGIALYLLREKFMLHPVYQKVRDFWDGIKEGLKSISQLKSKTPFILHTIFIWLMYYLMVYICVFSLDATKDLSPSSGLLVMIAAGFGMVVPTPGGIGAYHYLVMLGLGVLGVASDDGVSFATLVHTGQLVMTVITGTIAAGFLWRARRRKKLAASN
ncbi:lysylphosphatidylglycerol synthase transmembrane domain-containing protein [Owenweeksia hongkongensis]|uniref:lysylphosphatidylglycerol synthase transmembrane domain-containing protein n=1 Tax=Owenweeksia hongkongensis TaxID=253245 RepID=UPI003A944CBB